MARIFSLLLIVFLCNSITAVGLITQEGRRPRGEMFKKEAETEEQAYQRGRTEAQRDLANNIFRVQTYGGPPPIWYPKFIEILKRDYQIEMNSLAGCVVNKALLAYVKGYNEISEPVIKRRHGNDIFARVEQQAIRESENEQQR